MREKILTIILASATLSFFGCAKVGIKNPVYLPGLGETFIQAKAEHPAPIFNNGDIVKYKMLHYKKGIVIACDYRYLPNLKTWYCIVDFYPSSALIHLDFSDFDNYERRYVYEFELEPAEEPETPARWENM